MNILQGNGYAVVLTLCVLALTLHAETRQPGDDLRGRGLPTEPRLSEERMVFQTSYGDIEFGFYPDVAPVTVQHILKLGRLGAYNSNHFFRVDKGFVAQVADVVGGRSLPMDPRQRQEGEKSVPGEFSDVRHVRGVLSMGRWSDPNSGTSSFSVLLGSAPHLDRQYTVFGRVTAGWELLQRLEQVETKREGIFVMPKERITIHSSYVLEQAGGDSGYSQELTACKAHTKQLIGEVQRARQANLP
mmetsp:Transcript_33287/g.55823  ORF Transcript_33287/g.55823 Transcript_33287/m.55823 type:complete len:244 (-) Transcript_33287:104-835(-)